MALHRSWIYLPSTPFKKAIGSNFRYLHITCKRLLCDSHSENGHTNKDSEQKISGDVTSLENNTSKLDLAKPPKKFHLNKAVKMSASEARVVKKSVEELGKEVVKAVRAVAAEVGDSDRDTYRQVQNDLLNKLKDDSKETKRRQALGDILAGMNIEKKPAQQDNLGLSDSVQKKEWMAKPVNYEQQQRPTMDLFDAPPLNMFEHIDNTEQTEKESGTPLWDQLEKEELSQMMTQPPRNGWEEMILWTKQGKLWNFPIDNEQGMEEESRYTFDEHVMLDHLLDDGFPQRGPIRHFMEIIVAGLGKNYHLTVPEKREHIAWYREYFSKHKHLVDAVVEDKSTGVDTTGAAESEGTSSTQEQH